MLDVNGYPTGRPRDYSSVGCLRLVLMWYRTRGSCARSLSLMFGQTSSCLYDWLRFGQHVLLHVLSRHTASKDELQNAEEIA